MQSVIKCTYTYLDKDKSKNLHTLIVAYLEKRENENRANLMNISSFYRLPNKKISGTEYYTRPIYNGNDGRKLISQDFKTCLGPIPL